MCSVVPWVWTVYQNKLCQKKCKSKCMYGLLKPTQNIFGASLISVFWPNLKKRKVIKFIIWWWQTTNEAAVQNCRHTYSLHFLDRQYKNVQLSQIPCKITLYVMGSFRRCNVPTSKFAIRIQDLQKKRWAISLVILHCHCNTKKSNERINLQFFILMECDCSPFCIYRQQNI